ncbi:MAG: hypothetical protein ACOCZ6_05860 [Nanoarchaeota archaeon]
MGVVSINNLVIISSLFIIIIITVLTLSIITNDTTDEEDIKQTACFKAASLGICDEIDEQMGKGTKDYCCNNYNKCC